MKKDFIVFSLKMANVLANKGFKMTKSKVNVKNPKYMVYFFEDTPELRKAVDRYLSTI